LTESAAKVTETLEFHDNNGTFKGAVSFARQGRHDCKRI
jgi:hypothetical protein